MKRVLPSTIRRPHRLPPRPDCSVSIFVTAVVSPLFLEFLAARVAAETKKEKRNSQSESSSSRMRRSPLSGYYFYSVSSLVAARTMSPPPLCSRASFHLRVVLYHRDCIARVYVIRIGPNLHGTHVRWYPFVEYNFPTRTSRVPLLVPSAQS